MDEAKFDRLLSEAAAHEEDVSRVALGLETRVVARVMGDRFGAGDELSAWAVRFVWRTAVVVAVVTGAMVVWGISGGGLDPAGGDAFVLEAVEEPVRLSGLEIF
ncbi:MAG: hypothetical protein AAGD22_06320 [Verrucomicrobiota bacterium]